ncbi:hypothetical protein ES332_D02G205600v1 [Gossypium tomentosum]|uniref:Uncharacterized protein n=1 Tax=Gossypium tomentosum TaxID=34277 RepID=A0A5D2LZR6_GOSTO|nr:hypothetical protein ES332_D02G205600v1 [Gossypium tomentosum]
MAAKFKKCMMLCCSAKVSTTSKRNRGSSGQPSLCSFTFGHAKQDSLDLCQRKITIEF